MGAVPLATFPSHVHISLLPSYHILNTFIILHISPPPYLSLLHILLPSSSLPPPLQRTYRPTDAWQVSPNSEMCVVPPKLGEKCVLYFRVCDALDTAVCNEANTGVCQQIKFPNGTVSNRFILGNTSTEFTVRGMTVCLFVCLSS